MHRSHPHNRLRGNPVNNRPFTQHITQRLCAQSPRSLDAPSQRQSGQTTRPTARAETHQNLIHSNKEHAGTKTSAPRLPATQRNRGSRPKGSKTNRADLSVFSVTINAGGYRRSIRSRGHLPPGDFLLVSASQPHVAQARATEGNGGDRDRTDDPLLAKQVLSQLSYTPSESHFDQSNTTVWGVAPSGGFPPRVCFAAAFRASARNRRKWAREDLNLRPHAYQACALTS